MDTPKTLLITGCSSGIGLRAAEIMRERGWRVFASARRPESVEALRQAGFEDALQLDLDDSHSIARAVETVLDRSGGRLDALFNNGAYGQPGAVEDLSRAVLRAQFETNLFGWLDLTNRIIPVMRAQGHGRIVMNSSVLGLVALPFRGAYNASKFALEGLTDTLRLELYGSGIQVSPRRRLEKEGPAAPFTLPPDAVVDALIHALEAPRPRARYRVTFPTTLFATLRRLLPTRALDAILRRVSRDENR